MNFAYSSINFVHSSIILQHNHNDIYLLKKILLISFCLVSISLSAATYYVAPSTAKPAGNDSNAGTISSPWLTWHYAASVAIAGDTVFFRGGVYMQSNTTTGGGEWMSQHSGTHNNPICFFAYPPDVAVGNYPILDNGNVNYASTGYNDGFNFGISAGGGAYLHFKGLHVRNCYQWNGYIVSTGFQAYRSEHITVEQCSFYRISGQGMYVILVGTNDTLIVKNCDFHNNCDSINHVYHGGLGTGINLAFVSPPTTGSYAHISGCRAWKVSDTGYSCGNVSYGGTAVFDSCWALNNGSLDGDGAGFKFGQSNSSSTSLLRTVTHCISAHNHSSSEGTSENGVGFGENNQFSNQYRINAHVYNNFAYHNAWGFANGAEAMTPTPDGQNWYRNNIAYQNTYGNTGFGGVTYHDHNSWDSNVAITDADFVSLDTTGMTGPRKSNGSLPDITFGKLASMSDLIDKGVDVGSPYNGSAPDLGYRESYLESATPASPVYVSSSIENATPSQLEMTYSLSLVIIVPAISAFVVIVNSKARTVSSVVISGTKVLLTLASPVVYGDVVTVSYTKPSTNPLQTTGGGQAAMISAQTVTNRVGIINVAPVVVVTFPQSSYSGFVNEINAGESYDANKDNLTFTWSAPVAVPLSSTSGAIIKFLGPIVNEPTTVEFTVRVSDGKTTQSKVIPIEILPYKPELETAEISNIEASSFQTPNFPQNILDGNIGTMWAANGDYEWLIIKLKQSFNVQHVKLAFQPGQKKESFFDIMGSVDKLDWEPILSKSASCAFSGDIQVFEFPSSKTGKEFNYIKLAGLGNSTDSWNYISELKIFGYRHTNSLAYESLAAKIYPNPAKERLTIRIDNSALIPDFIQLIDFSGSVIYRNEVDQDLREFTIPIHAKSGAYIVQLGAGDLPLFTQKLIIEN